MERKALIDLMQEVEPSLSAQQLVPIHAHFWFTGKSLMGYNGDIAISSLCKTEFKGALPTTLLSLLKTSKAADIELLPDGEAIKVKAASSKFTLSMLPPEDFTFQMPSETPEPFPCDAGRFMQALEVVMMSIGNDTSAADYMGVTLMVEGKELLLFATDRNTLCHASLPIKGKLSFKDRVVLPTVFCEQLLRIAKGATKLNLDIGDSYALLEQDGVKLYGRCVEPDNPMDFPGVLDQHFDAKMQKKMVSMPTKMLAVLERACIVTNQAVDKTKTEIVVRDGKMIFNSKSERGEVHDTIMVEDHPEVKAYVDAARLKDGYSKFEKVIITAQAAIMTKDNMVYMVSAAKG